MYLYRQMPNEIQHTIHSGIQQQQIHSGDKPRSTDTDKTITILAMTWEGQREEVHANDCLPNFDDDSQTNITDFF